MKQATIIYFGKKFQNIGGIRQKIFQHLRKNYETFSRIRKVSVELFRKRHGKLREISNIREKKKIQNMFNSKTPERIANGWKL